MSSSHEISAATPIALQPPDRSAQKTWKVPLILAITDSIVIEATYMLAWITASMLPQPFGPPLDVTDYQIGATLLLIIVPAFAAAGIYPGYGLRPEEHLRRRVLTVFAVAVGLAAGNWLLAAGLSPQTDLYLALAALALILPASNIALRGLLLKTGWWGMPTIIVGFPADAERLSALLASFPESGLKPVGIASPDKMPGLWHGGRRSYASRPSGVPLATDDVAVIITGRFAGTPEADELLQYLPSRRIILVPDVWDLPGRPVRLTQVGGLLGVDLRRRSAWRRRLAKRLFDLGLTAPLLLLSLPLLLLISLLLLLDFNGPVIYRQPRYGQDARIFQLLKFRTMHPDADRMLDDVLAQDVSAAEEYRRYHKLKHDPRVTRAGRILRRWSLDELPQLFNVLAGDMSLVGPRPYLPHELDPLGSTERRILAVQPGLTGLWQVSARNRVSFEERKVIDRWYARHRSAWLDIHVLMLTLHAVLSRRGTT